MLTANYKKNCHAEISHGRVERIENMAHLFQSNSSAFWVLEVLLSPYPELNVKTGGEKWRKMKYDVHIIGLCISLCY